MAKVRTTVYVETRETVFLTREERPVKFWCSHCQSIVVPVSPAQAAVHAGLETQGVKTIASGGGAWPAVPVHASDPE